MKNKLIILALFIIIISSVITIINIEKVHENLKAEGYYIGEIVSIVEKNHIISVGSLTYFK